MKVGQHLYTRDGRIIGNAIITEVRETPQGTEAKIETDFGNGGSWFNAREIEAWWWTHRDGEVVTSKLERWRADRVAAQQKSSSENAGGQS
jgi:hypothetical protein